MFFNNRYLLRMILFTTMVALVFVILHEPLIRAFNHNIALNTLIFSVFGFGLIRTFYQMKRLNNERLWLEAFEKGEENFPGRPKTKLLKPLAIALRDPSYNGTISTLTSRSILVSIEDRLDETRDISRYVVGLLVFLGLLGTFWGLSQTIGAIAGVISGLDVSGTQVETAFQNMKQGLQSPLIGMGTAFSCSMFGLAGSLIVGFLDLQYGKALAAFYQMLEDKLSIITKNHTTETMANSGPAYSQGLLEQTVEAMSNLQSHMRKTEDNRLSMVKAMQTLSEKLSHMVEQTASHQSIMKKIAQNHIDLQEVLLQQVKGNNIHEQQENIAHLLRNLDATSTKMLEELVEGRARSTQELRNEIRLVARTLSALANGQEIAA